MHGRSTNFQTFRCLEEIITQDWRWVIVKNVASSCVSVCLCVCVRVCLFSCACAFPHVVPGFVMVSLSYLDRLVTPGVWLCVAAFAAPWTPSLSHLEPPPMSLVPSGRPRWLGGGHCAQNRTRGSPWPPGLSSNNNNKAITLLLKSFFNLGVLLMDQIFG